MVVDCLVVIKFCDVCGVELFWFVVLLNVSVVDGIVLMMLIVIE